MNITNSNVKGFAGLFNNKVTTINRNSMSGIIKAENNNFDINRLREATLTHVVEEIEATEEMKLYDDAHYKYHGGLREVVTDEKGHHKPVGIDEILKKYDEFTKEIENGDYDEKTKEIKFAALKDVFSFGLRCYTAQTYIESSKFVADKEGKLIKSTPYEKQLRRTRQKVSKSDLIDIVQDYLKNGISTLNNNKKVDKYNLFVKESYKNDPSRYDDEIENFNEEEYDEKRKAFYDKLPLYGGYKEIASKYGTIKTKNIESESELKTVKSPTEKDSSNTINTYI